MVSVLPSIHWLFLGRLDLLVPKFILAGCLFTLPHTLVYQGNHLTSIRLRGFLHNRALLVGLKWCFYSAIVARLSFDPGGWFHAAIR